jgi:uncharacterized membrane protein
MNRLYWSLAIALTVAMFIGSAIVYPSLPAKVPTHWNIKGEIDAYGAKEWATFLVPGMMVLMLGIFAVIPALSPKPFGIESFKATYVYLIAVMMAFFAYIQALILVSTLRHGVDMPKYLMAGMFLFFAVLGNVLGKVRRNFYVGIRVPWTLASDRVWNDTHRLAARLFVGVGILGFFLSLMGFPMVALGLLGVIVIVAIVYSFILSKRLEARGEV